MTIDLLLSAINPSLPCGKREFNGKYTKSHRELEITSNLITDQSTLINGDFATKIRRSCDIPTRKWKYQPRNRNRKHITNPSFSSFQGRLTRQLLHLLLCCFALLPNTQVDSAAGLRVSSHDTSPLAIFVQ